MAGFAGVGAVGTSLERVLNLAYAAEQPIDDTSQKTKAVLVRTDDLELGPNSAITPPALSILLYRVDFTKSMRSALASRAAAEGRAYLPLDLHYLLTAWADNAEHEHRIIGRTVQALEMLGALTGPTLDSSGSFDPQESVALLMEDMSTDDLMRTFEALCTDFRLSVPYLARVLVVSGVDADPLPPVLSVRTEVLA
jgi:hypothetical protein